MSNEEKPKHNDLTPRLYMRYVDDTRVVQSAMPASAEVATDFLAAVDGRHPSIKFTMELPVKNKIPFIVIEIVKNGTELETKVYRNQQTLKCLNIQ